MLDLLFLRRTLTTMRSSESLPRGWSVILSQSEDRLPYLVDLLFSQHSHLVGFAVADKDRAVCIDKNTMQSSEVAF